MGELVRTTSGVLERAGGASGMPALIEPAVGQAEKRFLEFFAAQIRNRYTREAYLRAVRDFLDIGQHIKPDALYLKNSALRKKHTLNDVVVVRRRGASLWE